MFIFVFSGSALPTSSFSFHTHKPKTGRADLSISRNIRFRVHYYSYAIILYRLLISIKPRSILSQK